MGLETRVSRTMRVSFYIIDLSWLILTVYLLHFRMKVCRVQSPYWHALVIRILCLRMPRLEGVS